MMYEAHLENVPLHNEMLTSDDNDTTKVVSHKKKMRATMTYWSSSPTIKSMTPASRSESDTSTKAISHRSKREEKKALLLRLVGVIVVRIVH